MSSESTKLYVPLFGGEEALFPLFWMRFRAYATLMKCVEAMGNKPHPDLPATELEVLGDDADGKKKQKARDANTMMMALFTIAFNTPGMMAILTATMDDDWPNGQAWKVVVKLEDKFLPDDVMSKVEMRLEIGKVKMAKTDDPDTLFEQISQIRTRYTKATLDKEDELAIVLENAPIEHGATIAGATKGPTVDMEELRKVMHAQWRIMYRSEKSTTATTDEIGLAEMGNGTKRCYRCQQLGHMAFECPEKTKNKGKGKGKSNKHCHTCGKKGHLAEDCWQDPKNAAKVPDWLKKLKAKKKDGDSKGGDTAYVELLLCSFETELAAAGLAFPEVNALLKDPNFWIADTGASADSTPHLSKLENSKKVAGRGVENAGGGVAGIVELGEAPGVMCDKHGMPRHSIRMENVKGVPTNKYNLCSLTKRMIKGWKLGGDANMITLTKDGVTIVFDIKIPTREGVVFGAYIKPQTQNAAIGDEVANVVNENPTKVSPGRAHDLLGHMSDERTRQSAKHLGWELTRGRLDCESCPIGKARQKNVPKQSKGETAKEPGQRVYLDLFSIKGKKDGPPVNLKRHGRAMVDEYSDCGFLKFFETKNGMVEPTLEKWYRWLQAKKPMKYVRCDNAGENKTLQARANSKDWKMNLEFEFTARDSPQMNSKAEVRIATICNKGRSMMARANLPEAERYKIGFKAFETASLLDNLVMKDIEGVGPKTRFEHFLGELPRFVNHLRIWGEAGTVTTKKKTTPKVEDRGVHCMFVGYSLNHAGDVYEMWDPIKNVIYVTRDVTWLRRFYFIEALKAGDSLFDAIREELPDPEPDPVVPEVAEGEDDADAKSATSATEPRRSKRNIRGKEKYEPGTGGMERKLGNDWSDDDDDDEEAELSALAIATEPRRSKRNIRGKEKYEPGTGGMERKLGNDWSDDDDDDEEAELSALAIANTPSFAANQLDIEQRFYGEMEELNELGLLSAELDLGTYAGEGEETAFVGAGLGGGFTTTDELRVLKYDEAMASGNQDEWNKAVKTEHEKMEKYKVFKPVPKDEVPAGAKILTSTWAMKKKANGVFRARMVGRGFEQVDGVHYQSNDVSSPVVNDMTFRIVLILMCMAGWARWLLDIIGAFLNGRFMNGEQIYMGVPQGFESFYPNNVYLLLMRTIYGTKQGSKQYYREMLRAFKDLDYERSKADPCMFFRWIDGFIIIWLIWVDDCLIVGKPEHVKEEKEKMKTLFECDDVGEMNEYVGCKVDFNADERSVRLTQPVMIQSFQDEFDLPDDGPEPNIPARAGEVLTGGEKAPKRNWMPKEGMKTFRSGVGKLLHMMRWTRPELLNSVRECSRYMSGAMESHMRAMKQIMRYVVKTKDRGVFLRPNGVWDGRKGYLFEIEGWSDSEYAKDATRHSVNGWSTFLNGAPVSHKSKMMPIVALSVTEAELFSAVQCAQDMLYEMRILNSMELEVKLPMKLYVDNKGAHDLCHNWSVGGRTRHVEVKQYFLRELKERGLIEVVWVNGDDQTSDIFTKNLPRPTFEKHGSKFFGEDKYMMDLKNYLDNHAIKLGRVSDDACSRDGRSRDGQGADCTAEQTDEGVGSGRANG